MSDEADVRTNFWAYLKKTVSQIPFAVDAVAMYFFAVDPKTPVWAKAVAFGALAYFILPLDAVPDAIPILGFGDDAAAIAAAIKAIGSQLTAAHRQAARDWFDSRPPDFSEGSRKS
jgi:uncharacterized membrane protein YkvA (DUF1232 family)